MITHPTPEQLVSGVAAALPVDGSTPTVFAMRVAKNALEIAARDLAQGPAAEAAAAARIAALLGREGDYPTLNAALVVAIRDGVVAPDDPALLDHLAATALAMLAIDQPRYAHELR